MIGTPDGRRAPVIRLSSLSPDLISVCGARTPASRISRSTSRRSAGSDERDDGARVARPRGATRPVQVVLRVGGRVDVDDEADVVDVDAPRGDVGGHQDGRAPLLEVGDGPVAGVLCLAAVQRAGVDAVAPQHLHQAVDAVLGAREQDRAAVARRHLRGDPRLVGDVDQQDVMIHLGDLRGGRCDRARDRIGEVLADEGAHLAVEGGGEQQSLPVGRREVQNCPDLRQEAHVGHAVGLVEHRDGDL